MENFLHRVLANAATSLAEEVGCRQFDVLRDPARPGEVMLYELYDDPPAFDAHLASAHFRAFDSAVAAAILDKRIRTWREVHR